MTRIPPPNGWVWFAIYLAILAAIATAVVGLRDTMLASLSTPEQLESWQDWRATAAKQDGKHGPVERVEQPSVEPPMRMLLRDHFPVVLASALVFPGLILGVLLLMLRGVWMQAAGRSSEDNGTGDKGTTDEQHADAGHR
jgi:hypothetical protein